MTEEKSWLGEWSFEIEDIGEIKLTGILSYAPNGKFVLEGSMNHASSLKNFFSFSRSISIKYIVGLDFKTQKYITLIDSHISNFNMAYNGGNTFKITPTFAVEGLQYLNSPKSLFFKEVSYNYSGLNHWLDSLYQTRFESMGKNKLTITHRRSKSIQCSINTLLSLSINFNFSTRYDNDNETGFFIRNSISVILKARRIQLDIKVFNRYSEHLRRLLQILLYQPAFILNSTPEKTKDKTKYSIYYSQATTKHFNNYKLHTGYLTHYNELTNFTEILKKWFILKDSDDYTYVTWIASKHLFLGIPFSEETFLENIRALEVYHKTKYPKNSTRQEKLTQLKERIKELLQILKNLVDQKDYVSFMSNEKDFIDVLADNRNYLTHYGKKVTMSSNLLTVRQLYSYAVKARIILLTLLLDDIGIEANKTFGNLVERHK